MGKKAKSIERAVLKYPQHAFRPEDLLDFVQLDGFENDWKRLRLDLDDLAALRIVICCDPTGPPIVSGTGGLRKVRFSPLKSHKGKSGGARVGYAFFQQHSLVLLVLAYGKNRKETLSKGEKNEIKKLLESVKRRLDEGPIS
jgi:hypothetical protein